jgi:acetylornithine deacetylase/succinyl-diaminopimelate desuccinylase-like protein
MLYGLALITRLLSVALVLSATVSTLSAQPDTRTAVARWVAANQKAIVAELLDLLSIPNVAADAPNIRRNAEHLRGMLQTRGFAAQLLETEGNPLVYGELHVPAATRTLLLYCHYDGQPVAPERWAQADPFNPVLRTGRLDQGAQEIDIPAVDRFEDDWRIYARSASDDKAPIVALLAALDALRASQLAPTSNIRVILDGEEEAGSPNLVPAIRTHRDRLAADLMIILDGPGHSSGRPTVALGARGIATFDLTVFGPRSGVHSGNYGNFIPNPAQRLAGLLASMKGADGRITIDGFNDGIALFTAEDRAILDSVPDDAERMLRTFGIAAPSPAFPKLQEALQFPTLNVRGLVSAHVGAGARTIIPDQATAAIDMRLVKETPGEEMLDKVRAHIRKQGYHLVEGEPSDAERAKHPKLARMAVRGTLTNAFRTPPSDPQARSVIVALERSFEAPPVVLRTLGGTVPIAPFIDALGFPALLVPTVNFDNNQHEENENLRLGHFLQSIEIVAVLLRM